MKIKETGDPDLFEIRSGGSLPVTLLGLVFFATGVSMAFTVTPMSLIFAGVGLLIALWRRGVVVDCRNQILVTWWGFVGPWKKTRRSLEAYSHVKLSKELRRSSSSSGGGTTYEVYPVRLAGKDVKHVKIEEPRDYQQARRIAETLAKRMALPLADSSSGKKVVRKPDALDESLREQVKRKRKRYKLPDPPARMRTLVTAQQGRVVLALPPRGRKSEATGLMVISVLAGAIFWSVSIFFLAKAGLKHTSHLNLALHLIPNILIFPVLFLIGLWNALSRIEVTVTPEALEVTSRAFPSTHSTIPADEIEELTLQSKGYQGLDVPLIGRRLGPHKGIIARTDRTTLSFAGHLPIDEQKYLYVLVHRMLTI